MMSRSASSSPLRKKPRLSSPTYDAQFPELDSHDFEALNDIETRISQEDSSIPSSSHAHANANPPDRRGTTGLAIGGAPERLRDHEEHDDSGIMLIDVHEVGPHTTETFTSPPQASLGFASAASIPLKGDHEASTSKSVLAEFTSATSLADPNARMHPLLSPERIPTQDHDAWFAPSGAPLPSAFATASSLHTIPAEETLVGAGMSPFLGFKHASGVSWEPPSAVALETAEKKLKKWEHEIESELSALEPGDNMDGVVPVARQSQTDREPLRGVENSSITATVPGPSRVPTSHGSRPAPPRPFKPPASVTSLLPNANTVARSFVAKPVIARSSAASGLNLPAPSLPSPVTPLRPSMAASLASQASRPATPSGFATPRPAISSQPVVTPQKARPLGLTPRAHAFSGSKKRPTFVTPFKPGMRPGEPGRNNLLRTSQPKLPVQPPSVIGESSAGADTRLKGKGKETDARALAITTPPDCKTLADCGLTPQVYTNDELTEMGFGAGLFGLANLSHFLYYRFNPNGPPETVAPAQMSLGSDSALETLLRMGCNLATKAWVDNHWSLIMWKMIGMACLDPAAVEKKWCWDEVMRQLRYRYRRELANGSRPALRLITTQDAPASGPLVLCISDILWTDEYVDAEGLLVPAHPELELTDGWYRLRATVDEALARAARNKILRVGRKIACIGARLSSPKKDPMEVLEAYRSAHLVISGNSTHLAPWHAKLGFQTAPFVATLGSLSPDGGSVALMDLVVMQVFPVGFIETLTTESGELIREGPRTEKDEAVEEDKWKERRSHEAAKLRDELENKLHRLESHADRLERIAGDQFQPTEDESPPDNIEDLVDELEDSGDPPSVIKRVGAKDAGWLSLFLRRKCETDREKGGDEIDRELAMSFPPRQVRNFRVLRVKDAQTVRRPSWRTAQLTVWDVMSLNATEGGSAGSFAVGRRYMITSLVPSQPRAWMGLEPGSEVYLSTRRDSKWKIIL